MPLSLMQRIDLWFGVPLCALFTAALRLLKFLSLDNLLFRKNEQAILLIELSEMGSTVLAAPAIRRAVQQVGSKGVFFLIFERNKEGITLLNLIDLENVITIDDSSLAKFAFSTLSALRRIWRLRIGVTIDLEVFSRCTALLTFLSLASRRVGLSTYRDEGLYRGALFSDEVLYSPHHHMTVIYQSLIEAGFSNANCDLVPLKRKISVDCVLPQTALSPSAKRRAGEIFEEMGWNGKRVVVFNPDPGLLPLRGWPPEHFAQLGSMILSFYPDVVIAVTGVARASSLAQKILSELPTDRVSNLTGKTATIEELLAVLRQSVLMVTIDSGPAHLAELVRLPRIVLFGPETPSLYKPLGDNVDAVFKGLCCSPCFSAANHRTSVCTDNQCMRQISPGEVFELICRRLNGASPC